MVMRGIIIKENIKILIDNYLPKMDNENIDTFVFYVEDKLRNCKHYLNVMSFEDKIMKVPKYIITAIDYEKSDTIEHALTFTSYDIDECPIIVADYLLEFINKSWNCNYTNEVDIYIELYDDFPKYFDDTQTIMIEKYNIIS